MALTGKLGTHDSQLGNIVFGLSPDATTTVPLTNTLTFTETLTVHIISQRNLANTLAFTQSLATSKVYNKTLTNTLIFTEVYELTPALIGNINNHLTFTTSQITRTVVYHRTLSNTFVITEHLDRNNVKLKTITNTLLFTELFNPRPDLYPTTSQSLLFTQTLNANIIRNINNHLVLSQTFTQHRIFNITLSNNLLFNQSLTSRMIYTKILTQTLTWLPFYRMAIPIPGQFVDIPAFYGALISGHNCHVIIQSPTNSIVLPCPLFGDTISNQDTMVMKKSMNNVTYTYIRRSPLQKVSYSFQLGRLKSLELREFFLNNTAKLLRMINWKNETWVVYLLTNPLDLVPKSRYDFEDEMVLTTLEFMGVKILG